MAIPKMTRSKGDTTPTKGDHPTAYIDTVKGTNAPMKADTTVQKMVEKKTKIRLGEPIALKNGKRII